MEVTARYAVGHGEPPTKTEVFHQFVPGSHDVIAMVLNDVKASSRLPDLFPYFAKIALRILLV